MLPAGPPGVDPAECELLVTRATPHTIVEATQPWFRRAGYLESDVAGRSVSILQGEGTCTVTLGALWSALQVKTCTPGHAFSAPA